MSLITGVIRGTGARAGLPRTKEHAALENTERV